MEVHTVLKSVGQWLDIKHGNLDAMGHQLSHYGSSNAIRAAGDHGQFIAPIPRVLVVREEPAVLGPVIEQTIELANEASRQCTFRDTGEPGVLVSRKRKGQGRAIRTKCHGERDVGSRED